MPAPLRRIACLGDLHAEDRRLEEALARIDRLGVDAILCVGDLVDGSGDADRAIALLAARGVTCVRGNHDRWLLAGLLRDLRGATQAILPATRAFLAGLPGTRRLATVAGDLLLCHGVGDDDMAELRADTEGYALACLDRLPALQADPTLAMMIGGHTHAPMLRRLPGLLVINAGTLQGDGPIFLELDLGARRARAHALGGARAVARELPWPNGQDPS